MLQSLLSLLVPAIALCLVGCGKSTSSKGPFNDAGAVTQRDEGALNGLRLLTTDDAGWQCGSLRLYPIVLTDEAEISTLDLLTLDEAMQTPGFRITEMQEFGRSDQVWYRGLTVQNKTQRPVLLMAGDVIQGGNQDRVVAQDYIIAANSLQNIEVFCVEAGRSYYYNPEASEQEKHVAAFYGYHSVCSPSVRSKVFQKEQSAVWEQVAQVTRANRAETATSAYTAIGEQDAAKTQREGCVRALKNQFQTLPHAVGYVAARGDQVASVEIFRLPELFSRRLTALLEGLAVEAVSSESSSPSGNETQVKEVFKTVAALADSDAQPTARAGKTTYANTWVHLYSKW
ncbi:MAG: DUF6569 family protein [Saprospiraceae bacterium]|nr:hypothetical protein [Saprospiraceae bacterium]MDW8229180.1 DUF6569 family protein [Saprospiraceae bacterium]